MAPDETAGFLDRLLADNGSAERPVVPRRGGAVRRVAHGMGRTRRTGLPARGAAGHRGGWRLGSRYWGHGYATEAATATLDWGFGELGLTTVLSIFEPDNVASGRVMDRLGFATGYRTTHPGRGLPLVVRSLQAGSGVPGTREGRYPAGTRAPAVKLPS